MPEPVTMTVIAVGALAGMAGNFLTAVTKGAVKNIKKMFSDDELTSVLKEAFGNFKESYIKDGGTKDEKALIQLFDQFFSDERTIMQIQPLFQGGGDTVDFNLLKEVFVSLCIDKGIDIKTFDFFQAMASVVNGIETLARKKDGFRETFKTEYLEKIQAGLRKRGEETNVTFARFKYLRQLILHNQHLQFTGIPDLKEKNEITLPSVFVMQRARESVPAEDYKRLMDQMQHDETGEPFTGEGLHLRRMLPVKTEDKKEAVKFDKVLEEGGARGDGRFVVLGKPGSGKSSLLKYLMLEAARLHLDHHRESGSLLFPILVEIRKFENALSKTTRPDYCILDFLYDSMRRHYNLSLPAGFFEPYLESGRALLLFDGLDEVAAESRRDEVCRMISAFTTNYHGGNTVIVTSRIAGYSRAQFSTTHYRHFTLEDFNDEEIGTFIQRWYHSRMKNEAAADEKADDLKKALGSKPRIRELAKNPLLLTIIGIIHRYEAQLPEDRLVLYDKATEALLYTWDNVKEIIDEKFKLPHRRRFLEKTAFHLQSIEKGDEAGTVMTRNELYEILLADFCKIFNCENWEAKDLVDEFLDRIRSRAGLLVETAPGLYGFAHKTFQEYFAAKWVAKEAILNFDLGIMIEHMDTFIDNAFWQETLLLALRALPNKQALKVLEHILHRDPHGIETYFYHNHYFVVKFIAEQGEWLDNKDFVQKQIDDFFEFSWNNDKDRSYYKNKTWRRFLDWAAAVSDSLARSILCEKLLPLAQDEKRSGGLRRDCARALGHLGYKDKAAEILLSLARDEKQEGDLRFSCAQALGNLGYKEKATAILLPLAEDKNQGIDLRFLCAEALGPLGYKEKATDILLTIAEDEKQEGDIRRYCAEALGNLGYKDKAAAVLLPLAEDKKQDGYLRLHCVQAVGNLGYKEKAIIKGLLTLAQDKKQDGGLRRYCAQALGNLGYKDKAAAILLPLAQDEKQSGRFQLYCAEALGNLGYKDKAAAVLLPYAEDKKQEVWLRRDCAEALGNLGYKDKAASILLPLAEDKKKDGQIRRSCAQALGNLGFKDLAAPILISLYLEQTDKYSYDARWIYNALWDVTKV